MQTITMALYDLVAHPEYIEPIREEIESIIAEDGWSKASIMKMRKLESFMKESQRYSPLALRTSINLPINNGVSSTNCQLTCTF